MSKYFAFKTEYQKEAKEQNDFTVLESTPQVKHAMDTAKMQSNVSNVLYVWYLLSVH